MRTYLSLRNFAAVAVGGLLAAFSLSGAAHAITDTIFRYSAPKTGFFVIPAAAFVPSTLANGYVNDGVKLHPTTANDTCFMAPVNLPNGAKMTALAAWYIRGAADSLGVEFIRQKLSDGTIVLILSKALASTNGARGVANFAIAGPALQTVDNRRYAYTAEVCLENSTVPTLYAMRIAYTYATAGD